MADRYLIILNPTAGNGKAGKEYPRIDSFFASTKADYEIILTRGPGDAINIARDYPQKDGTAFIAAGGDGTCNEVVNGLLSRQDAGGDPPLLGLLPVGRGNDFSYSGAIPPKLDQALEVIPGGAVIPLDAGQVIGGYYPQGRFFINGLGIGFDTMVGLEAAKMKGIHSSLSYVFGAVKTLIAFAPSPRLIIEYDDKTAELTPIQVSLMNGRRMGGSFYMGPQAVLNDGLLDICMVRRMSRMKLVKMIAHYTKGTQEKAAGVTMGRASSIVLTAAEGGMVVHADGETICLEGKSLTVNCIPGALRLIVP